MSMICTVCGAENMEGSIYCEDCGARLPVAATAQAPAPISPPPAPIAPPPAPIAPPAAPMPANIEAAEPTRESLPAVEPTGSGSSGSNVCSTCGAVNAPGENYCEDCGAALSEADAPPPIPAPAIGDAPPPISSPPSPHPTAAPASHAGKPRLEAVDSGETFLLSKDENAVGRRSPVDGIFPEVDLTEADRDSYISRRHGRISMSEQGPVYEDLGSSNGSFHNGHRLQQGVQAPLKDGDRLRLGRTELVFRTS